MPITRGQMKRQLYMGGGIMNVVPREPALLGGIKKAVKKVTKGVKKIASSDLGKAALIGAAAFGIPGTQIGGLFGRASFGGPAMGLFGSKGIGATLASSGFLPKAVNPAMQKAIGKETVGGIFGGGIKGNIAKFAGLAGVSTFLTGTLGMTEQQAEEELARDPSKYLELYYRNLNPPTADTNSEQYEQQVRDFVTANTSEYAVGGRVGYQDAGPVLPPDPTQPVNPFGPKPIGPVLPDRMASNTENDKILEALFEKYLDMGLSPKEAADKAREEFDKMSNKRIEETRGLAAMGGRIGFAGGGDYETQVQQLMEQGLSRPMAEFLASQGITTELKAKGGRIGYAGGGDYETQVQQLMEQGLSRPMAEFLASQGITTELKAQGGRIGFDEGTPRTGLMSLINETIDIPMQDQPMQDPLDKYEDEDMVVIITMDENGMPILKQVPRSEVMPGMAGGDSLPIVAPRNNKAKGDSASMNAMQAAGIEGLPMRQNPKGVKELDLRETGGFIQPVGIKEKEDDIPAMLSNNEFVFTADAVRGAGDGNVNVGAQRMYDMMKKLEAGGRV